MVTPPIPSEWGWLAVGAWAVWQVYGPKLGINTRFSEVVTSVNERIDSVGERIDDIEHKQSKIVAVTEVIAIESDDIDGGEVEEIFDEEEVIDTDDLMTDSERGASTHSDD